MSKKPNKPFKLIKDAPAFIEKMRELTGDELKVWMYLWLRTNREGTAFPGNKTMSQELGIYLGGIKNAKKGLREKGWLSSNGQRVRGDGTFSTVLESVHTPWAEKQPNRGSESDPPVGRNTDHGTPLTVGRNTDVGKTTQHKEYTEHPEVPPLAYSDVVEVEQQQQPVVVVVPPTPQTENSKALISGYTQEQIADHAERCKLNPWVHKNWDDIARVATLPEKRQQAIVGHLMEISPPKRPLKMVDGKPLPYYRQVSGQRNILDACSECCMGGKGMEIGKDGLCDGCRTKREAIEFVRATAAPGSHAARNPELHVDGAQWTKDVTKI